MSLSKSKRVLLVFDHLRVCQTTLALIGKCDLENDEFPELVSAYRKILKIVFVCGSKDLAKYRCFNFSNKGNLEGWTSGSGGASA